MRPLSKYEYYRTKYGVLYCGDCLKVLPLIKTKINSVITDPVWPNCPKGLLPGSDGKQKQLLSAVLKKIYAQRVVIIMRDDSDPRFLTAVPKRYPCFRVQKLPYAVPGYFGRQLGGMECAYSFGVPCKARKGKFLYCGMGPMSQSTPKLRHPCPRSLVHMIWLVDWWSELQDTVIDPFAGSGTTLIAAEDQRRAWIGIEIEQKYCRIAKQRLIEHNRQTKLF